MRKLAREPKAPKKKDTLQKLFLYNDIPFSSLLYASIGQRIGDYLYFIMGKIVIICCAEIKC